jgi:hypothetical protein
MEESNVSLTGMQELLNLVQALSVAVDRGFMKREHAGAVWKRILTLSGIDTTKKEVREDDVS